MSQQLTKDQLGWLCLAVSQLQSNLDDTLAVFDECSMEDYHPSCDSQAVPLPTEAQLAELHTQLVNLFAMNLPSDSLRRELDQPFAQKLTELAQETYQSDDCAVDPVKYESDISVADGGIWVSAWVWISRDRLESEEQK